MSTSRRRFTATLLPNGKVLVAGGYGGSGVTSTAELYDPKSGLFALTGTMNAARANHTATLLRDGKVLIAGGTNGTTVQGTIEIYDPATGIFTSIATPMISPRTEHTATLAPGGAVFFAGGTDGNTILDTIESFNPSTSTFTLNGHMSTPRKNHAALALTGSLFVWGGTSTGSNALNTSDDMNLTTGVIYMTSSCCTARSGAAASLLPTGKWVISGGTNGTSVYSSADGWVGSPSAVSGSMSAPRIRHTSTVLSDGRLLIAGGDDDAGHVTASADVLRDSISTSPSFGSSIYMNVAREVPSATLLPDGRVLIAGGTNGFTNYVNTAEVLGGPSGTILMRSARAYHTATLLRNGKVFLAGGYDGNRYTASTEFFDPTTNTFSAGPDMLQDRGDHTATMLRDGRVLLAGGYSTTRGNYTSTAEVYDPVTNTFTMVANTMSNTRLTAAAALLDDGRVLIAGGVSFSGGYVYPLTADLYDPSTNRFTRTVGDLAIGRSRTGTAKLPNGKVLIVGGQNFNAGCLASAELYDPATQTFSTVPMTTCRNEVAATLLASGSVLVAGGSQGGSVRLSSAEIYETASNSFRALSQTMNVAHSRHAALQNANGQVLIIGGQNSGFNPQTTIDVFNSGTAIASRRPTVSAVTASVALPGRITVTGSNFRSDCEGAGGATQQSVSAFPMLALQRVDSGDYSFGKPDAWSDTTLTAPMSGIAAGQYRVSVITGGAQSGQKISEIGCPSLTRPSGLTAFATTPTRNDLSWSATGTAFDHYNVYRANGACGSGSYVKIGETTATSYADSTTVPGAVYSYAITAAGSNNECESALSNCADTGSVAIPVITAGGPTSFCPGGSVTLTSSATTGNWWSTGETSRSIVVVASMNVTVTVTDANGHSATSAPLLVKVHDLQTPTVTASGPLSFCEGGSVTLTSSPATSYLWSNGATTQSIVVTQSNGYYVTIVDSNGCSASSQPVSVNVMPAPVKPAIYTYSSSAICEGSSLLLVSSNANGGTYLWSTGETTQSITVTQAGSYTVAVTNANGCSTSSDPLIVTVGTAPAVPAIIAPDSFCSTTAAHASAQAEAGITYNWSIANGTITYANGSNADYVANPGAASVTITVTATNANGCSSSTSKNITVVASPQPRIDASGPTTFCQGGSVTLTASGGDSYLWSTGATTSSITVSAEGTYTVAVSNVAGCSASTSIATVVHQPPAVSFTGNLPVCMNVEAAREVTPTTAASYQWSITNGTITQSAGHRVYFLANANPATLTVTVTDTNGCSTTESQTVTVTSPVTPTITAQGATTFCAGGSVTLTASSGVAYSWSNGATTQAITVNTTGAYLVTVTDASGCSAQSAATNVTVNERPAIPVVTTSGPTTFCSGGSVNLTAPAGYAYLWSNGATSQSINVTSSGTFSVTVTNASGCSAQSGSTTVTANANPATPVVTASGPLTFCTGGSVTLTAPSGYSYLWSNGATTQSINVTSSGTFSVTVTNASGCSAQSGSTSVTVNANPATPIITAGGSTSICAGSNVTLTAPAGFSYRWSNGATTQSINATAAGNYTVTVTNANGCSATSAPTTVTLKTSTALAQPSNITISRNTTGTLSVSATGTNLRYQWYQGTAGNTATPLGTQATQSVGPYKQKGTYSFWVRVTGDCGVVSSGTVTVTVN